MTACILLGGTPWVAEGPLPALLWINIFTKEQAGRPGSHGKKESSAENPSILAAEKSAFWKYPQ